MPNTVSSKKRMRQNGKRAALNKDKRSEMRSAVRRVEAAIAANDKAEGEAALKAAYIAIDRCAKHNILHANKAANKKSRLAKLVSKL
jgi:small subunit ribosomal protein S20